MFSCYVFWAAISLSGFLTDFHVFGCDDYCTDKPVFNPPRLAVKFGTSASAKCSVCQHACHNKLFGLEKSVGKIQRDGTTILWTVDKMVVYPSFVMCYYNNGNGSQCCSTLPITVYQPPTEVDLGFVGHSGPMVEGQQFVLYCSVKKVAPLKNLILTLYQGENAVARRHFKNNTEEKPADRQFNNVINATKENDGAQYMCHAQLDMRPDSVLYIAQSGRLIVDVHYKPHFNGPAEEQISLTVGDPLHLNCSAKGNPRPWVTWTLPSAATFDGDVFSVDSVTTEHRGLYICSMSNKLGMTTVEFNVDVQVNYLNIIFAVVAAAVALGVLIISAVCVYYYRVSRTGQYSLKDVLRFRTPHVALPAGEL
ncbi:immunoglobulin superfamily member 10-like [Hippocampus comes]|uniref:Immunoglobulin superfamily member 10-like n=1 Tax=Hippocampus comes TaxID=109280 RepID=A0A3Q3DP45_HIPCM|nr:PREDICTED: immunoglobulin superfamily member 10-like [Hippocampus comes]